MPDQTTAEPAPSPIRLTLAVIRSQVTAALADWDGQGFDDPADAVMAAVTPGLESILGALQAGAAGISGPGAGDEPSGADTGPQEAAEPLLPPGEYARVEIMGHDSEYGFVTERTRAGVLVMVISDWNGRVKAEIPGQSLYKFVPLPTPLKRPGPATQRALTSGLRPVDMGPYLAGEDDAWNPDLHAIDCNDPDCLGECEGERPF